MSVGGKKVKIDNYREERVRLQESGDYCKMCYAGMTNSNMTAKQKVKESNKSTWVVGGVRYSFVKHVCRIMNILFEKQIL